MHYYVVSILGSSQPTLTYFSENKLLCGDVVEVLVKSRAARAVILKEVEKPAFNCKTLQPLDERYDPDILESAQFISDFYCTSLGESLGLFTPYKNGIKPLESLQLEIDVTLSGEQEEAFSFIQKEDVALLFGDTGSGKTEIYIRLIEQVLNQNKTAIFLMPEISLTPQMEKRLKKQFGALVAIWHSRITKKKKEQVLESIQNGEVRILAGARSALFLPLPEVGLIVVDEEHDDSYKSQNRPRYHARDLAVYLGKKRGAKVVLGSATPAVTSYERYPVFRLKGRYFQSSNEMLFEESSNYITPFVEKSIWETLKKEEQVIVFLPTRANFKHLLCDCCGQSVQCPYCSVSMSLHRKDLAIKCHYCGYIEKIPEVCPNCHQGTLLNERIGTAEIVEQLQEKFPGHTVGKFDRDEVSTENKLKKILKEFNDKEIDILVGTQMLSKGHDYHDVTLAVILGIDHVLGNPDYRAREKALSLLNQIAGRSGRKKNGRVIVQTLNREFFQEGIQDHERFIRQELEDRKGIYPPFSKMALVLFSHKWEQKAKTEMEEALNILRANAKVEIVGYGKSQIEKIASKFRYLIILRTETYQELLSGLHQIKHLNCEIDVNPVHYY